MVYLVIAAGAALFTLFITTDAQEWFLLPLMSVVQMDSSTLPRAIEYVTDSGRYLLGRADSQLPTCIPDFSAGFQVLGLFNARISLRNRVAEELARHVCAGGTPVAAANEIRPPTNAPVPAETPAPKAVCQDAKGRTPVTASTRLDQRRTRILRRNTETTLIERLKSQRFPPPVAEQVPPRWSCEGLRSPEEINWRRSNAAARVGPVRRRWPAPWWQMAHGRRPFKGGPPAA